ncbi:diguanylate cyclase domain-containing protein [Falsiroseomonas sp. E2-1-a20]|uniref:GGDEF domain-containing protein n=1 Tax=Falsiroseomonas sp. E2-1-a20 TaxID=3239300 RepID=UPI003F3593F0
MDGHIPPASAAAPGPPQAGTAPLSLALVESRARWRDFALLAADLVFELDAEGRFAFLAPEEVLGHAAEALLGTPAAALLASPGPGPFASVGRRRNARARLRRADGTEACLDFCLMPQPDGTLRGVARDITTLERQGEVAARALRRANALGSLLRLAARQGSTEASLDAILAALPAALSAEGAALLLPEDGGWRVAHTVNARPPLHALPPPGIPAPPGLHAMAAAESGPCLVVWRAAGQPPLEADDRDLLAALALPVAALRAKALHERELTDAADGDALTGLLNRRGFTDALARRLWSTCRRPGGALVFLDLDGLKPLNDRLGHEVGDAALRAMAARLRSVATGQDLVGRLGGDEFCLWMDGVDAAQAADRIRHVGNPGPLPGIPEAGPAALRASFGIALPTPEEEVGALLSRADAAMYVAKRANAGERRR